MDVTKRRLIGLDVYRIIFALIVAVFHITHISYSQNAIASTMQFFFMLSGFSLVYVNQNYNVLEEKNIVKNFYIKRFATIFPLYLLIELFTMFASGEDILMRLEILPLRLLGIQTAFDSFDFYVGVSWFNSCLIIAYLLFPLLNYSLHAFSIKTKRIIFTFLLLTYVYINCICIHFGINIYYNMFVRIMEFCLGAYFADVIINCKLSSFKHDGVCSIVSILAFISLIFDYGTGYDVVIKIFSVLLIISSAALMKFDKISNESIIVKLITYLSAISFEIYMLQDVILNKCFNPIWSLIDNNYLLVMTKFLVLIGLSILIHHIYTIPSKNFVLNKLLKRN